MEGPKSPPPESPNMVGDAKPVLDEEKQHFAIVQPA